jgi:hypothetical protein
MPRLLVRRSRSASHRNRPKPVKKAEQQRIAREQAEAAKKAEQRRIARQKAKAAQKTGEDPNIESLRQKIILGCVLLIALGLLCAILR